MVDLPPQRHSMRKTTKKAATILELVEFMTILCSSRPGFETDSGVWIIDRPAS